MHARRCTLSRHARTTCEAAGKLVAPALGPWCWRITICLCLTGFALAWPRLSWAGDCGLRPQDELWLVSARQCCDVGLGVEPELSAQRLSGDSHWQPADIHELYQPTTNEQIVVVYIHGNRVPSEQAAPEGQSVYRMLTAGVDDVPPLRFVIWSWPSAQVRGPLKDVRIKAQRTDLAGYCLAWVLTHLPENQHVSLLGYSFGARIATGAMHLVGGGALSGRMLPPHPAISQNTRVVMLAGALDNTWLRPGGFHELAISHLDYLLNLYNCCDPILKRYHVLYKRSCATAIGYAGMYTGDLGEVAERIEQHDVCNVVQQSHEVENYLRNAGVVQRIRNVLFWRPVRSAATIPGHNGFAGADLAE
jgi:hypothetical protein